MRYVGSYQGIRCYECTRDEYIKLRMNGSAGASIYIINGAMIKNNVIIGSYDGETVKEDYRGVVYLSEVGREEKEPEYEVIEEEEAPIEGVESVQEIEMKIPEIDFKNYSEIVDKFFEELVKA